MADDSGLTVACHSPEDSIFRRRGAAASFHLGEDADGCSPPSREAAQFCGLETRAASPSDISDPLDSESLQPAVPRTPQPLHFPDDQAAQLSSKNMCGSPQLTEDGLFERARSHAFAASLSEPCSPLPPSPAAPDSGSLHAPPSLCCPHSADGGHSGELSHLLAAALESDERRGRADQSGFPWSPSKSTGGFCNHPWSTNPSKTRAYRFQFDSALITGRIDSNISLSRRELVSARSCQKLVRLIFSLQWPLLCLVDRGDG